MALHYIHVILIASGCLIQSYNNMYIEEQHKVVKRQAIAAMYLDASCDLECKPSFKQFQKDSYFVEDYSDYRDFKPVYYYDQDCSYECRLYPRIIKDEGGTTLLHNQEPPVTTSASKVSVTVSKHVTAERQMSIAPKTDGVRTTIRRGGNTQTTTRSAGPRPTKPMTRASVASTTETPTTPGPTDSTNADTTLTVTIPTVTVAAVPPPLPAPITTPTPTTAIVNKPTTTTATVNTPTTATATVNTPTTTMDTTMTTTTTTETTTMTTTTATETTTMSTMLVTAGPTETTTKNLSYYLTGGLTTESTPNWDYNP